jgi:fibrillarin-like pre-rRNA processing protein
LKNSSFLQKKGKGLLVLKAASIDSSAKPARVFERQTKELKPTFDLIQTVLLEPFQTAHAMVFCEKKM